MAYIVNMGVKALAGFALAFVATATISIISPVSSHEPVLLTDPLLKNIHVPAGDNFSITCYDDSHEEDRIKALQWFRNNQLIENDSNKILIRKGKNRLMLTIIDSMPEDSGVYHCTALYRKTDTLRTEIKVTVYVPKNDEPTFEVTYERIAVDEFSNIQILCKANGMKTMTYVWYDQNEQIISSSNNSSSFIKETSDGSLLTINGIKDDQYGGYSCTARNKYGTATKLYLVKVNLRKIVLSFLPVRSSKFVLMTDRLSNNIHAPVGEEFKIICYADSGKEEQITSMQWSWKNKNIANKILTKEEQNRTMLTIVDPKSDDSGAYLCSALYKGVQAVQKEVYVTFGNKPKFEVSYENVILEEYSDLEITCYARGTTPMTYEWYDQNEQKILSSVNSSTVITKSSNGSLLSVYGIKSDQSGSYMCSASNKYGMTSKVYKVEVTPKVNGSDGDILNVNDIKILKVTTSSVEFDIPPKKKFDYMVLTYADNSQLKKPWVTQFYPGYAYRLVGFPAGSLFYFNISVIYKSLNMTRSLTVTFLPDTPDVVIMNLDRGNIRVEWVRSIDQIMKNTIDLHELSYYTIRRSGGRIWEKSNCSVTIQVPTCMYGNKYTVAGLSINQYYEIRIRAHTSAGYSDPYTQKIFIT